MKMVELPAITVKFIFTEKISDCIKLSYMFDFFNADMKVFVNCPEIPVHI